MSVTVQNTGTLAWNESSSFRLGMVGDYSGDAYLFDGTTAMVLLPEGANVLPGESVTFSFVMTAPAAGTYHPSYRMVWDGHEWFGEQLDTTVNVGLVADFSANVTSGYAPLTVQFNDQSTGTPTAWNWYFGDGTGSSEKNPVHVYSSAGTYNVTLNVSNAGGWNETVKAAYITAFQALTANFMVNVSSGTAPLTVQFNDTSTGDPTSWLWDFGDGMNSTVQNPVHTYQTAGNYSISLTAANEGGSNTTSVDNYIYVIAVPTGPVADFTANVTCGELPLTVAFIDTSTCNATSWQWNFGDGTANSTVRNPVHKYTSPGLFTVTLTANNSSGSWTKQVVGYIWVYPLVQFNVSSMLVNESSGSVSLTLTKTPASWPTECSVNYTLVNDSATLGVNYDTANEESAIGLNMVANSDFDGIEGSVPSGWSEYYGYPDTVCGVDSTYADGDMNAVRMKNTNLSRSVGLVSSPIYVVNTSYTYSAYMQRLSNNVTAASIGLVYYYANGTQIAIDYPVKTSGDVPLTLTRYSAYVNPVSSRPGTAYVRALIVGVDKKNSEVYATKPMFVPTRTNITYAKDSMSRPEGTLTFAPDESNKTITVDILNNGIYYPTLYFKAGLTGAVNASIGANNYMTVGIKEASALPVIQLDAKNYTVNETDNTVSFVVTKTGNTSLNASVNYTTNNGTAGYGLNYSRTSGKLVFLSNDTSLTFNVSLIDNPYNQSLKYFYLNLSLPVNCTLGSNSSAFVYIIDDDMATVPDTDFIANVTAGAIPLTVQFNDMTTGDVTELPTAWQWNFGDGTANSTIKNPIHTYTGPGIYNVTLTTSNAGGSNTKQVVGYIWVYPLVQFNVSSILVNESSGSVSLTLTKTPASWPTECSVNYTLVNDSATLGMNYDTASEESLVNLNMIDNPDFDGVEGSTPLNWSEYYGYPDTVCGVDSTYADGDMNAVRMKNTNLSRSVGLVSSPIYVVNTSYTYSAYMQRLSNNVTVSSIGLIYYYANGTQMAVDYPVKNGGDVPLTLTRYSAYVNPVASRPSTAYVRILIVGVDKKNSEVYVTKPMFVPTRTNVTWASGGMVRPEGTVTFAPDESSKTITVDLLDNGIYYPTLYFKAGLTGAANASIGANNYMTVGVRESSQLPVIQLDSRNYTFNETDNTVLITVTKAGATSLNASVNYTTNNGTALSGLNYTKTSGKLVFMPNDSSLTFNVTLIDGPYNETWKYFYLNLSLPVNCTLGGNGSAFVYIVDDDMASAPGTDFTANATAGPVALTVQFYDTTTGDVSSLPTAWQWNFGDGTANSTVKNPVHTYTSPGIYNVTLTTSNAGGSNTKQATNFISVYPLIQFSTSSCMVNETDGTISLTLTKTPANWPTESYVNYTLVNDSAGLGLNYQEANGEPLAGLNMINNSGFSGIEGQVPYGWSEYYGYPDTVCGVDSTYSDGEMNAVRMKNTNLSRSVGLLSPPIYVVNTSYTYSAYMQRLSNNVTAASIGLIYYYANGTQMAIDYPAKNGGDVPLTLTRYSAYVNPVASRPSAAYVRALIIGVDKKNSEVYVTKPMFVPTRTNMSWASDSMTCPTGTLTFAPDESSKNITVSIINDNLYDPTLYFKVGITGAVNASIGTNNYVTVGIREANLPPVVQLEAKNYSFNETDNTVSITVVKSGSTSLNASVNYTTNNGTAGYGLNYTRTSGKLVFLSNDTSLTFNVSLIDNIYNQSLKYFYLNLSLPVNCTLGNNSSAFVYIIDDDNVTAPTPNFTASAVTGDFPLTVYFTDTSLNTTSWLWDFGDNRTSTVQNPVHTYVAPGNYTVTLKAFNQFGLNSTLARPDYITVNVPAIVVNFTSDVTTGTVPLRVSFWDNSTGYPTGWNWSFGDDTYSSLQDPVHTYTVPGNYTVTLDAWNNYTSGSWTAMEYIVASSATPDYDAEMASNTVPFVVGQGQEVPVTIRMNNTGLKNWTPSDGTSGVSLVALDGWMSDAEKFGPTSISLENDSVAPGDAGEFSFVMHAPNVTGTYHPTYQLKEDGYGSFGRVLEFTVNVTGDGTVIVFSSPLDDYYSNETVNFIGIVLDPDITSLTVMLNGINVTSVPVIDGNFSALVNLTAINNVTVGGIDGNGTWQSATLMLDGDRLPADYEQAIGFDPLNPDSDNVNTPVNESGMGVLDGDKCLNGDQLSVVAKYAFDLDPFRADNDGDGLTDYFELMKLGIATDPFKNDTDGNGIIDALEDADGDGLTNLQEQQLGTDPLSTDTDGDGLTDSFEVNTSNTNPLLNDSDGDGLADNVELKLGSDPNNPDSNGNGIIDGNDAYTYSFLDTSTGANITLTGRGDVTGLLHLSEESSPAFQSNPARVGDVVKCSFTANGTANLTSGSVTVSLPYDPVKVPEPANITLAYFDRASGTYIPFPTTVYVANHTASATVPYQYLTDITILDTQVVNSVTAASAIVADPRVGYAVHLTTAWLQQGTTFYYLNGANFAAGHYLLAGQGWYNDYTGIATPYDPFTNYNFGAGIRVVYGSINVPISSLNPAGNHVEFDHGGGGIGIQHQIPYSPSYCTGDLTYTLYYVNTTDNDGDGLLDYIEDMGFYDGNYNFYHTNSSNPDTDGDEIPDGIEVKVDDFQIVSGFRYYNMYSNPTKNDTDDDNLNDYQELVEIGTDPYNKDTDNDAWTDGDEIHAVYWPVATDPLKEDTDNDTVIDSIDPDPLDASNHTMPLSWHASEFAQGLLLGDIASSDPRHQDTAFELGQFISQFVAVGNARDLIVQANQGKRGPELLFLAVGCIPGEGELGVLGKGSLKAAKWLAKVDDVAKRVDYTSVFLKDARLLDKEVDNVAFARTAWGADARALEEAGVLPDTLGEMALHGFNPRDGKQVVDNLIAGGTSPETVNKVLKGEARGSVYLDYTKNMEPSSRINDFTKASDREIITQFKDLDDGRIMSVQTHLIKNRNAYLDDITNRVGPYDYNNKVQLYMHKYGLNEQDAKARLLSDEGITYESTLSNMRAGIHTSTELLGEKAALNDLMQRTGPGGDLSAVLGVTQGFYKTKTNEIGFDFICIDKNGNYVIIEAKGKTTGLLNKYILRVDSSGRRQMSDEWIKSRIEMMHDRGLISDDLYLDLKTVANGDDPAGRTIKKEVDIIQDGPLDGKTASSTFADMTDDHLGILNVHVIKTGGVT